jgi:hypothetical protein
LRRFLPWLLPTALLAGHAAAADVRIGVDWNGDGLIQTLPGSRVPQDAPSDSQPFVFWVNHDQDDLETGGETWPIARPDANTPAPDSSRDLEDFTRLHVEIDDLGSLPGDAVLTLAWASGSTAELNLFRNEDPDCSRGTWSPPSPMEKASWPVPSPSPRSFATSSPCTSGPP